MKWMQIKFLLKFDNCPSLLLLSCFFFFQALGLFHPSKIFFPQKSLDSYDLDWINDLYNTLSDLLRFKQIPIQDTKSKGPLYFTSPTSH